MTELAEQPDAAQPTAAASTRNALRETGQSLASVFKNPSLRRIQLALAGSMIGDWAYGTAVAVWAYGVGGATAVGVWFSIRLLLMAVTGPVASGLADKWPRKAVMIATDLTRAVLIAASAALLFADAPAAPIFVIATLTALLGTPFRAAQRALMPALVSRPEELTASNGSSSTIESLAIFIGPVIGATLISLTNVATVFVFDVVTFVWSMLLVIGVKAAQSPTAETRTAGDSSTDRIEAAELGEPQEQEPGDGFVRETLAGFREVWRNKDLLVVTAEVAAQTVIAGASMVFLVVIAVDILLTGPKGIGYLDSVSGIAAIVGGLYAISRAAKRKLGQDMVAGVVLWSLPLVLVTLAPVPVAAFAAVALLGFANPLVDVNMDTIVQRVTPDEVMGRVFGAQEACLIATAAIGSLVMPVLIHLIGLRSSLAVVGIAVSVLALVGLPRMRSLDRRLGVPAGVPLLQAVPMFAPLSASVVEALARSLVRVQVPAGQVFLREGEESDRFYVIESGLVEVTQGQEGRVLRREGPGEFFGEIGLLRDVPRTATITAVEDTVLQALPRAEFLDAVTGQSAARSAADDIVARRLTV
ncbi:MAG TPA: MFS transporter [Nocardioidaceae bacterium]|nr:MFS transporter [Nocardioidaceae bacterium]